MSRKKRNTELLKKKFISQEGHDSLKKELELELERREAEIKRNKEEARNALESNPQVRSMLGI